MKQAYSILRLPVITEKSTFEKEKLQTLTFKVARGANKIEIKRAVEQKYGVTVLDVNTMRVQGKVKRLGRFSGKRADWKKAVVTLKAGDRIELAQNV
jgi:large subunit ribosomal protein L23